MVYGDDAALADVAVKAAVGLLVELAPHLRLHEEGVLGAPVVMGEDDVRVQVVDEHLHVFEAVIGDVVYELVHLIGVLVEVGERVLKAHEKVALLEYAGAHEAGHKLLAAHGLGLGADVLPAGGAVGLQVRGVDIVAPVGYVAEHFQLVAGVRHGAGRVGGEEDGCAPLVHAGGAADAVAAQVGVYGVAGHHGQGLVLVEDALRPSVWLEHFKENLAWCGHGFDPLIYQNTG